MLRYPALDPVALQLGPLKIHWYGLMYLLGFAAAWLLAVRRTRQPWAPVARHQVEDLVVYSALGVVIGGRLGSGLFYNLDTWLADPLWIFRLWEGGMAFHGGLLGVLVALGLYARKIDRSFLAVADFAVPLVPIGLGLGRIGNFIGQELWGRAADLPWAVVFPRDPEGMARHPSQLYQAALEGGVLFAILFWYSRRPRPTGAIGGLFLALYALFRFLVEFVREPDSHIGFDLFGWLTRGQLLSLPMFATGLALMAWAFYRDRRVRNDA